MDGICRSLLTCFKGDIKEMQMEMNLSKGGSMLEIEEQIKQNQWLE